ncbi:ABC transporter substrate-binding protein [Pusillimonas sp.]|uniref:ABC transporter substrate-binding protein n=1 Tax=Pusillimonas sp. TaxID=3040095 RepID=UPI0029BF9232|nr:ABC transporter substrate-binding protein [Pusillimonas sp.]MDX3893242.1 ABC transporter substrate-binding protein [Pusillimonas sp.]
MIIAVPDLISTSYFPAIAAVKLGLFEKEGLDVRLERISPVNRCMEALRDGSIQFAAASAHAVPSAFPEWKGAKLLAALSQNMYWFLVLRKDLQAGKGDITAVKGLRIGAAPWVDVGLKKLLADAGIDEERDGVKIGPVPGAFLGDNMNFGVAAAKALEAGLIDGFWANGMGAEVAVRSGAGDIVIDARRGDGPPQAKGYTFSALATSDAFIREHPEAAAAAVRALVKTHQRLKADPGLAPQATRDIFPPEQTALIEELIARDLPFYSPDISRQTLDNLNDFQTAMGLVTAPVAYEDAVATQYSRLWQ